MLTEVMLMRTLSKLRDENEENFCDTFIQIVGLVKGPFCFLINEIRKNKSKFG